MTDVLNEVRCFECDEGVARNRVIFVRHMNLSNRWGAAVMCDSCGVQRIGRLRARQPWLNDIPGRLCLPCRRKPGRGAVLPGVQAGQDLAVRSGRARMARRDSVRRRDGCGMAGGCVGTGAPASPQSLRRRNRRTVAAHGTTGAQQPHTGSPVSSNSRSCPAAAWARCLRLE